MNPGPDLPFIEANEAPNYSTMISFEDSVVFLGHFPGSENIYQMKCDEMNSCQWTLMKQKLKQGRYGAVAFLIGDELVNCSENEG